ncbi:MAG TPA: glycosyltransferase [Solirubrobacteraceae bacterium]|nr:glycosyltransferase [Solirubrobacteraceae bacterium]
MSDLPRTLFIGISNGAVAWYRCALPATVLGCPWVGVRGEPTNPEIRAGNVPDDFTWADVPSYEVVIVQQVRGAGWLKAIREWQAAGVTVLYEIDDWLHGVRRIEHDHADKLDRATVETYELCMRAADGIICSTDWLARRYLPLNRRTWVCRNGIDLVRYRFTRPPRDHVGIGWAGGTGHKGIIQPWVDQVREVMRERPETHFVTIGQPFATWLHDEFGDRTLAVPFTAMEVYPGAMTHLDIALAPAGKSDYFKGKSDLRWLEAAALKLPCIADPDVYPEIEHGVTGFHAASPAEAGEIMRELVDDAALRERVGAAAFAYVSEYRTAQVAAQSWAEVLREAVAAPLAA